MTDQTTIETIIASFTGLYDAAYDPTTADTVTLAGIKLQSPGVGRDVRDAIGSRVRHALETEGPRAFETPRSAAAIHEAGHIAWHLTQGRRIKRAWIEPTLTGWIGMTEIHGKGWNVTLETQTATAIADHLEVARHLLAGVTAERLFEKDFRAGSSIDEIVMSQLVGAHAATLEDQEAGPYWLQQVAAVVETTLRQHRTRVLALGMHLFTYGALNNESAERIWRDADEEWKDVHPDHVGVEEWRRI
jgi:hypothetical protein